MPLWRWIIPGRHNDDSYAIVAMLGRYGSGRIQFIALPRPGNYSMVMMRQHWIYPGSTVVSPQGYQIHKIALDGTEYGPVDGLLLNLLGPVDTGVHIIVRKWDGTGYISYDELSQIKMSSRSSPNYFTSDIILVHAPKGGLEYCNIHF